MFVYEIAAEDTGYEGETECIELYPGSRDRKLTRDNSEEFIALTTRCILGLAKDQMNYVRKSILAVAPEISLFSW